MLLKNIQQLLQIRPAGQAWVAGAAMAELPALDDAYLLTEGDRIAAFGPMSECPQDYAGEVTDCRGRLVLPAWCDSHSHLVYAGDRASEWLDRLRGLSYAEIAARGGGILHSAQLLNATSEDELYAQSRVRLARVLAQGTGALEIKSGYGLTVAGELKMLRVIRRLAAEYPVAIRATFLGAHALPAAYAQDKTAYLRMLTEELLPQIAAEGLADYVDIFCEKNYFDVADTERVLAAGQRFGLAGKIHVNQFTALGGVAAGVAYGARSVDHLEVLEAEDLAALRGSTTMPVALPGCSFFLGIPYTPARRIIDAGLPLALATDYNPGSSPSGNMNFVVSLACTQMKLLPNEAINAATLNGAYAMGLEAELGSITVGKRANLLLTRPVPSLAALPYAFGESSVERVLLSGRWYLC
ncbi:imidazolonepropionase [Neolewinella lacunae]|uniref:Imidazolonepropionase n=1 Tax=Neolewinella lacunae TaxID=1517758 RepID=A0A923PNX4_9BACT|nr:imidazolonepropionase [Neolewinella lacunae]MBC6993982.1 imidazolonepropionase [Neolewinella lacunae]MDN3635503.1 imidazolonepropionase [Neolewinella lacunae]